MSCDTCIKILKAESFPQIRLCYPVIRQLRPHLTEESSFAQQVERQIAGGYSLVYLEEEDEVKAAMGFRFLEFLAWGKVLYIDDLITAAAARKRGYASQLLEWAIALAKEAKCDQVHLDSGPRRHDAHRLYLNRGFKIVAHHFSLDLQVGS